MAVAVAEHLLWHWVRPGGGSVIPALRRPKQGMPQTWGQHGWQCETLSQKTENQTNFSLENFYFN